MSQNQDLSMIELFPDFYDHPVIRQLAPNKKWTISQADKTPIDMNHLRDTRQIYGAFSPDATCLVSLPETFDIVPYPANHAYYLDAEVDQLVVLDIEPECSQELKDHFLSLPYLYGETSLSGKGYHLIFPYPKDILDKYPDALNKIVMKDADRYFEVLLQHYVTFTRNLLPPAQNSNPHGFLTLFEALAKDQKPSQRDDFFLGEVEEPDIPHKDFILKQVSRIKLLKKLSDCNNDLSVYEFAWGVKIRIELEKILKSSQMKYVAYNNDQIVWLIYLGLSEKLKHRPKHDTKRNGMPWLLYLAQEVIAKPLDPKNKK